jgi:hypothetical protein
MKRRVNTQQGNKAMRGDKERNTDYICFEREGDEGFGGGNYSCKTWSNLTG